jgi:hypothetical protein
MDAALRVNASDGEASLCSLKAVKQVLGRGAVTTENESHEAKHPANVTKPVNFMAASALLRCDLGAFVPD